MPSNRKELIRFSLPRLNSVIVRHRELDKLRNELGELDKLRSELGELDKLRKELEELKKKSIADKFRVPYRTLTKIEQRFCLENGIAERYAMGDQYDDSLIYRRDPFWIQEGRRFDERPVINQIDALEIRGKPRFSNAIMTLVNAFSLAKAFNISKIYHPKFTFIKNGKLDGSTNLMNEREPNNNTLISNFFYNYTLRTMKCWAASRYEIMQLLRPAMNFEISDRAFGNDKTLFIHVRSGDIFDDPKPHPGYGQPPFAFYKKVICSVKWESAVLVYENESNPVIECIKRYLNEQKIRFETCSGSLESDLHILSRASNLVIGRGTFIYPLLCLSKNIKNVYCFEHHSFDYWGIGQTDIKLRLVKDREGSYVTDIFSYWSNSPEQARLMLEYPEENLDFR
jgi:hypothetical protein